MHTTLLCSAILALLLPAVPEHPVGPQDASAPTGRWVSLPLPSVATASRHGTTPGPILDGVHLRRAGDAPVSAQPAPDAPLPPAVVRRLLEQEARRRGQEVRFQPGVEPLLARASEPALSGLRAVLAELEAFEDWLSVSLEVSLVPLPSRERGGDESPVPAPLLAARDVRSGECAFFGQRLAESFLAEWDVDVAADSGVANPLIGTAVSGRTLHLTAARVDDGRRVHLSGLLDMAEIVEHATFDTGSVELGVVEQPTVAVVQVAFSGVIAEGEALELEFEGLPLGTPDWRLEVRARAVSGAGAQPAGQTAAAEARSGAWIPLDLAWLAGEGFAFQRFGPGHGIDPSIALPRARARRRLAPADVAAMIAEELHGQDPPLWSEGLLLVPSSERLALRRARELVRALEARGSTTSVVLLRHGPLSVRAPVASGARVRVIVGLESLRLVDYDTELAPQTWMAAPRVERVFDGLAFEGVSDGTRLHSQCWVAGSEEPRELSHDESGEVRLQLVRRHVRGGSARSLFLGANGLEGREPEPTELLPSSGASPALTLAAR